MLYESRSDFVAVAQWSAWESAPGTGPQWRTVQQLSAESDSIAELRAWCATMRDRERATGWRIHATWPISERFGPPGHRLHGKRENAFREGWQIPREDRPTPVDI